MTTLPSRPNLDHLRRQAKAMLAAIGEGDLKAIATITRHLPAAKGMKPGAVKGAGFRLADAQAAIARQSGFESWPRLARHVEQLRALEGTWGFVSLEVDGNAVPPMAMSGSRILIDGDRFRTESPEAVYEGVFNIDVEAEPHGIDIEFVAGPEAGNWNYGIFRLSGDTLEICLDMNGKPRPKAFKTSAPPAGSGQAYEVLKRTSGTRPEAVTGGTGGTAPEKAASTPAAAGDAAAFAFVASVTLTKLQGEWTAERVVRDGQELPAFMLKTGRRSAKNNEVKVGFGGQVMIDALVRIDEGASPMQVDYLLRGGGAGAGKGSVQHGIMEWRGDVAWFCMGAPGQERPGDFECAPGSGRTLSAWRKKK